jgi:4'-phosphopantetheinyl transferase EntD
VIVTLPVGDGMSLMVCCPASGVRLRGRELRAADRAAADRAWSVALEATGLSPEKAAGSRAHTEGAGAALVGRRGTMLGVDLVSPFRVTPRHARAILDRQEWEALAVPLAIRAALGWGLKEAAAKAMGNPARYFPAGLTITSSASRVEVIARNESHARMAGYWKEIGSLLCVWVIKLPEVRSSMIGYWSA